MCLRRLGQRQLVAHHSAPRAIGELSGKPPGPSAVVTDQHAVEGDVRIEQQVEVEVRGRDRGDLTPGPKCIERGRQMRPADQVRDGVHRPAREPDSLPATSPTV